MAQDLEISFEEQLRELHEMDAAGDHQEDFPETLDDSTDETLTNGLVTSKNFIRFLFILRNTFHSLVGMSAVNKVITAPIGRKMATCFSSSPPTPLPPPPHLHASYSRLPHLCPPPFHSYASLLRSCNPVSPSPPLPLSPSPPLTSPPRSGPRRHSTVGHSELVAFLDRLNLLTDCAVLLTTHGVSKERISIIHTHSLTLSLTLSLTHSLPHALTLRHTTTHSFLHTSLTHAHIRWSPWPICAIFCAREGCRNCRRYLPGG